MKDSVARIGFKYNYAYLSSEFGLSLAMKKTGLSEAELEAIVGRYKKGARKGLLKGEIAWLKVDRPGWVKTGSYDFEEMKANGFVCKTVGLCFAFGITVTQFRGPIEHKWGFNHAESDPIPELARTYFKKD